MVDEVMKFITEADPEVGEAIEAEAARQRRNLELIASENIVSEPVMMAMGSVLTNKYAEGYPGKRYYGGCQCVDVVESIAIERAKKLFGCDYANVQPHSGAQANMAVFIAMLKPGDTVMGMNLDHGGHLTHGSPVNFSGMYFNIVPYGVNDEGYIDYDELEKKAMEAKPKLIVAGASAYCRTIDFKRFREIADRCGAYLMVDMAHIAGLVAAGLHPSPIPYADVVTTTTHTTLRGPRGGMILANEEANKKFNFNKAIFPGSQGGPLEHVIAAKAICFGEALKPEFKTYQEQVLKNAKALAEAEGIDKKAEAMKKYGEAAVIEMIMNALPEIAKNVAEPLSKVDKITMYGEGNSAKLLSDIVNGTTQVTEGISAGMGLDLKSLLAGALGGKLAAGNSQPVQVTVTPQAQPDAAAASADTPEQQV